MQFVYFNPANPATTNDCFEGDIRTNHIWLLHRMEPFGWGRETNGAFEPLWITDPEDVQPISKRDALLRLIK